MAGRKLAALTCRGGWMRGGKGQQENCIRPESTDTWVQGDKCGPTESFQERDEVRWQSPQDLHLLPARLYQYLTSMTPKQQ